ncbi:hypothetical protein D9M69_447420 [compost metagenome]
MNAKDQALWNAGDQLHVAGYVLEDLRALFVAIQKLGDEEVAGLARVGKGLAEEWSNQFDVDAERLRALVRAGGEGRK